MGRSHIPQGEVQKIQVCCQEMLNPYLNFHRPCGFATETADEKGKIKKEYEAYLTPFEKLRSIKDPERF